MDSQVLEGVLEWAAGRPVWQQEAIRRLLNGYIEDEDVAALTDLCVAEQRGDALDEHVAPLPASEDVPRDGAANAVVLGSISEVADVNALATDQTLPFVAEGLTIVQGDNGSGKSGYARILKQVCRTRSRQEILPDVFSESPGLPTARIAFTVDGVTHEGVWTSGSGAAEDLEPLSAVGVYDSQATSIYVDKDNELAYRPFGLDLYDRLVEVCDLVKHDIGRRIETHAVGKPRLDALKGEHEVGRLIDGLSATTSADAIEEMADWTDEDAASLTQARTTLEELRKASPAEVAQGKRSQASRARDLAAQFATIIESFSGDKLANYLRLRTEAAGARQIADATATATFENAPLRGVGSDAWRRMWEAARAYSTQHAFTGEEFPATHDDSRCVLCQQELDGDANERLRSFDAFVSGHLQTEAERLEGELDTAHRAIESLDLSRSAPLLAEVEEAGGPSADNLEDAFLSAERGRAVILADWEEPPDIPGFRGAALPDQLTELAEGLETAAEDLESAEGDSALAGARGLVSELEARERLSERRQEVLDAVEWHKLNDELETAKGGINSRSITDRSRQVTEKVVSQGLLDAFDDQLRRLGAGNLRLRLKPQGRSGQVVHKLALADSASDASPGKILSEGERSVVGLAAFLAESDLAPLASPIVLDDPVTSLDHDRRELVALRIYEQAQQRQVAVFTHDQVFASEVRDVFKNNGQSHRVTHHLVHRAAHAGLISEGPPWQLMKVGDRVRHLNARCDDGEKLWKANNRVAYDDHAKRTLGLLRETWERAVEEVLLGGVVQRFTRQVRTLSLKEVTKLTAEDAAAVQAGMAFTSTEAHDQSPAAAKSVPEPHEIREQIAALKRFCAEYAKRPVSPS